MEKNVKNSIIFEGKIIDINFPCHEDIDINGNLKNPLGSPLIHPCIIIQILTGINNTSAVILAPGTTKQIMRDNDFNLVERKGNFIIQPDSQNGLTSETRFSLAPDQITVLSTDKNFFPTYDEKSKKIKLRGILGEEDKNIIYEHLNTKGILKVLNYLKQKGIGRLPEIISSNSCYHEK